MKMKAEKKGRKCKNCGAVVFLGNELTPSPQPKPHVTPLKNRVPPTLPGLETNSNTNSTREIKLHLTLNQSSKEEYKASILHGRFSQDEFHKFHSTSRSETQQKQLHDDLYESINQLRELLRVTNDITSELDYDRTSMKVVQGFKSLLRIKCASYFKVHISRDYMECKHSTSVELVGIKIPIDKGNAGKVAKTGKMVNHQKPNNEGSVLYVPIVDDTGSIEAVVELSDNRPVFSKSDEMIAEIIAGATGKALRRVTIHHKTIMETKRTQALLQVSQAVHTETDLDSIIQRVISTVYSALDCDRVTLFMVDPVTSELWCKVSKDAPLDLRLRKGQGIAGTVAATGEKINIPDCYKDPRFNAEVDKRTNYYTKSMLCLPIRDRVGNVISVIQALNKSCVLCGQAPCRLHPSRFVEDDEDILESLSTELAAALNKHNLEAAFKQFSKDTNVSKYLRHFITQFSGAGIYGEDEFDEFSETEDSQNERSDSQPPVHQSGTSSNLLSIPNGIAAREMNHPRRISAHLTKPQLLFTEQRSHSISKLSLWKPENKRTFPQNVLQDWAFNYFEQCNSDEKALNGIVDMFYDFDLINKFHIDLSKLQLLLLKIKSFYLDNPYHNFMHAFSVLHVVYMLCNQPEIRKCLSDDDILALFVASLSHDIDHPGLNNQYQINSSSDLAITYNDTSVLESHHAAVLFRLLRDPSMNIFSALSRTQKFKIRQAIINAIIFTDLSKHNELVSSLQTLLHEREGGDYFQISNKDDTNLLRCTIIHLADLSNPILPFDMAKKWAQSIFDESYHQHRVEKSRGLPTASYMEKNDPLSLAALQVGFITYVASPLWKVVFQIFPCLQHAFNNVTTNKLLWEEKLAELQSAEADDDEEEVRGDSNSSTRSSSRTKAHNPLTEELSNIPGRGEDVQPSPRQVNPTRRNRLYQKNSV